MKGHGTHVAGTAAGKRASDGISESAGEVDGIAPGAKLSFVDLGRSGQPTLDIPFPPSSIYQHGIEAGSKIHSSSWGIGYNNYRGGEYILDDFMFNNPDLLIVFAAGNSGDAANAVGSPATCKNGISGTLTVLFI
jgi:subtilisin family serine protease